MSLTISSKAEFFSLSRRLLLGNRLNQWTFDEFAEVYGRYAHPCNRRYLPKKVGIRSAFAKNTSVTGLYSPDQAMRLALWHRPDSYKWLFDEGAPNHLITLQGEVMSDEKHLYLRYSHDQRHMRRLFEADRDSASPWSTDQPHNGLVEHLRGLQAWHLLRRHMDAPSWDCFQDILQTYEYPIIEFCCCRQAVGVLNWNTIIWEVRTHY